MVQPQPDGPMQWEMSGEESGGVLRVPPELAANEVVTRLLGDNQQLRGRTNDTTCFILTMLSCCHMSKECIITDITAGKTTH